MSESEVTDWFPPEIKPVRDGWYEVRLVGDAWYRRRYWCGYWTTWSDAPNSKYRPQFLEWRGLAADPNAPTGTHALTLVGYEPDGKPKLRDSRSAAHAQVGKTDGEETGPPVGDEYTILSPGLPPLRGKASSAEALAGGEYTTSDPLNLAGHVSTAQPRTRETVINQLLCRFSKEDQEKWRDEACKTADKILAQEAESERRSAEILKGKPESALKIEIVKPPRKTCRG